MRLPHANSSSSAEAEINSVLLPQSSIQIQRPQLDVGIFERLNSIVLSMDPEYLSFIPGQERQVYGQIISKKLSQVQSSQVANGESAAVS